MGGGVKLRDLYFDRVYTPVYDATVGRISPYRRLQENCVGKLPIQPGDSVLSLGVGTGNEVQRLCDVGPDGPFRLTAIDLSVPALKRAARKAGRLGLPMDVARMDAHALGFQDAVFDKLICVHTMDFLSDHAGASREALRVLKPGGAFVVTYPSGRGSRGLGKEVGKSAWANARKGKLVAAVAEACAAAVAGAVYFPLALTLRPPQGFYTRESLDELLSRLGCSNIQVEEDPVYQDFIVSGRR